MANLDKLILNWEKLSVWKTFVITEDIVTITTDDTKWVAPYNTSYWYTNIEISADAWIDWIEWAIYSFVCDSSWVVSANRNARVRIGSSWDWIPLFSSTTSILAANSYLIATQTRLFVYKTTNSTAALHMINDTTYSALSVANVTSANTTGKLVSWKIFKDSVTALAVLLTWNQTVAGTKTFSTSPVVPSKTSAATNTGTAIATEAQVYLKANTSDVLTKTNTTSFTPSANYHPATKKYVDDTVAWKVSDTAYSASWDWVTSVAPSKNAVYDHFLEIQPTVMTASQYSQVSSPVAGKIYFIKQS